MSGLRRMGRGIGIWLGLAGWLLFAALPVSAEPVRVRAAAHDGYGRIVFNWQTPVPYTASIDGSRLTVRFGRAIESDLGPAVRGLRKYLASGEMTADGQTAVFTTTGPFGVRAFDMGAAVVVDLIDPAPAAEPRTEATAAAAPAQPAAEAPAAAPTGPVLGVRTGQHEGYSRIVFDWTSRVGYGVDRQGETATIRFDRAARPNIGRIQSRPPRFLRGIQAAADGGGLRVTLRIDPTSRIKHFRSGPKIAIDILAPDPDAPPPAATPQPSAQPAQTAVSPQEPAEPARQPEAEPTSETQPAPQAREPEPQPAAQAPEPPQRQEPSAPDAQSQADAAGTPAAPSAAALSPPPNPAPDTGPQTGVPVAPPQSPDTPDGTVARAPADGPAVAPTPLVPVRPTALTPTRPTGTATVAAGAANLLAPSTGAAADLAPSGPAPEGAVTLRIDWSEPVAAAVFRRAGHLWVAFDKPNDVDIAALKTAGGNAIRDIQRMPVNNATVLRFNTIAGVNPTLRRDGLAWLLDFQQQPLQPQSPIETNSQPNSPVGARLFLPVPQPGKAVAVFDPEVGDTLVVVPVIPLGHGLAERHEFPQVNLLPTGQGVVVRPIIDSLRVRPLRQGIELTSTDQLQISPVTAQAA
ncbi:MAG: hypothetical protein MI741_06215, partial [Rhodospirillales bacterium]|nr:hypothetical protein [Rhodospirillales bacterium]